MNHHQDIPLHSPYIGLIYARYLQFRILKFHEIPIDYIFPIDKRAHLHAGFPWIGITTPAVHALRWQHNASWLAWEYRGGMLSKYNGIQWGYNSEIVIYGNVNKYINKYIYTIYHFYTH